MGLRRADRPPQVASDDPDRGAARAELIGYYNDYSNLTDICTFKPLGWLKLYANVRNVFDELYIVSRRPFGARPNAPRWTQVGVKADF